MCLVMESDSSLLRCYEKIQLLTKLKQNNIFSYLKFLFYLNKLLIIFLSNEIDELYMLLYLCHLMILDN